MGSTHRPSPAQPERGVDVVDEGIKPANPRRLRTTQRAGRPRELHVSPGFDELSTGQTVDERRCDAIVRVL